jgi:hypothetical protein
MLDPLSSAELDVIDGHVLGGRAIDMSGDSLSHCFSPDARIYLNGVRLWLFLNYVVEFNIPGQTATSLMIICNTPRRAIYNTWEL